MRKASPTRRFARSRDGMAAVEFALLVPVMAIMIVGMVDAWSYVSHQAATQAAATAGARYYLEGGTDDSTARAFALAAWSDRPADAAVTITRSCECGSTSVSCSSSCNGGSLPKVWVSVAAQSAWRDHAATTYAEVVRVR